VHLGDPGRLTEQWRVFVKNTAGLSVEPARRGWQPGKATTSRSSSDVRPERTHYCSTCEIDVLRMDHFCPWTGNTVGLLNYKYFLQLAGYGCLLSLVGVVTTLPEIIGCAMGSCSGVVGLADDPTREGSLLVIFFLIAALATVLFGILFFSHIHLACKNVTCIEEQYDNMPNPYDQGGGMANIAQVFGRYGWDWYFPISPRNPLTDGFSYSRKDEVLPAGLADTQESRDDVDVESGLSRPVEKLWQFRYTGGAVGARAPAPAGVSSWFPFLSW